MGLDEGSRWHRMVSDFSEHGRDRSQWSTVFKDWGRWMTSAKWSLAISSYRQWFGIHPQKKCLYGSCGIQHQMPRDLGGILSTRAFGNRQTDLVPGYGSWSGPWTGFRPSWPWSRKPVEHWLRQSPMDKRAFVGVQEFSGGDIKACCWSKKNPRLGTSEKVKNSPFPR